MLLLVLEMKFSRTGMVLYETTTWEHFSDTSVMVTVEEKNEDTECKDVHILTTPHTYSRRVDKTHLIY